MTGGQNSGTLGWSGAHSSTEQLAKGGTQWILTENSLPAIMSGLGSISFNNQIFTTGNANILNKILFIYLTNYSFFSGGYDKDAGVDSDEILLFDPDTKTFNNIGKLEQRRSYHSVSVVDINDFICS